MYVNLYVFCDTLGRDRSTGIRGSIGGRMPVVEDTVVCTHVCAVIYDHDHEFEAYKP